MLDQPVAQGNPVVLWYHFDEVAFRPDRIGCPGEPQPPREPADVGVDNNALRLTEGTAKDNVGCLPAHSRQAYQFFEGLGNFTGKSFNKPLAAAFDVFRLRPEKTGGLNNLFNLSDAGSSQFGWRRPFFEQAGGD